MSRLIAVQRRATKHYESIVVYVFRASLDRTCDTYPGTPMSAQVAAF